MALVVLLSVCAHLPVPYKLETHVQSTREKITNLLSLVIVDVTG